jgi:glutamate decarboxylase
LRVKGWQVPAYPMPANREDLVVQRALMRLGVSRDLAGLLMDDLRSAVRQLRKNPPRRSVGRVAAGGYNHG